MSKYSSTVLYCTALRSVFSRGSQVATLRFFFSSLATINERTLAYADDCVRLKGGLNGEPVHHHRSLHHDLSSKNGGSITSRQVRPVINNRTLHDHQKYVLYVEKKSRTPRSLANKTPVYLIYATTTTTTTVVTTTSVPLESDTRRVQSTAKTHC